MFSVLVIWCALQDILKYTEKAGVDSTEMKKALRVMCVVPKAANDMMQVGRLQGFDVSITVARVHGCMEDSQGFAVSTLKRMHQYMSATQGFDEDMRWHWWIQTFGSEYSHRVTGLHGWISGLWCEYSQKDASVHKCNSGPWWEFQMALMNPDLWCEYSHRGIGWHGWISGLWCEYSYKGCIIAQVKCWALMRIWGGMDESRAFMWIVTRVYDSTEESLGLWCEDNHKDASLHKWNSWLWWGHRTAWVNPGLWCEQSQGSLIVWVRLMVVSSATRVPDCM